MAVPVVFILGLGHSGSTLLDILLGSHPEGIGVGAARVLVTAVVAPRTEGGPKVGRGGTPATTEKKQRRIAERWERYTPRLPCQKSNGGRETKTDY